MKIISETFYHQVFDILKQARTYANKAANFAVVIANWHIGRLIVEEEQNGSVRAEYGKFIIKELSNKLTKDFGKGYDPTNLKLFRKFYNEFPVWQFENTKGDIISNLLPKFELYQKSDSLCHQFKDSSNQDVRVFNLRIDLSWSHYRILMRVKNLKARQYYIYEASDENWNVEQLKRQINSFYYERLLSSIDKIAVKHEAKKMLKPFETKPDEIFKDPSVLSY